MARADSRFERLSCTVPVSERVKAVSAITSTRTAISTSISEKPRREAEEERGEYDTAMAPMVPASLRATLPAACELSIGGRVYAGEGFPTIRARAGGKKVPARTAGRGPGGA